MSTEKSFLTRVLAAAGAVTMSMALMVSYFATPQIHAASSILA